MESKRYVIIPLRHDELKGNVYRIGCFKTIGSLVNFSGLTIGKDRITEYSYAKHSATLPENAVEVSNDVVEYVHDNLKHIYCTVKGLINFAGEDKDSKCYIMQNQNGIYLINNNPESDWNNYELIKGPVVSILEPNAISLTAANEKLEKVYISEFLFYEIMDYIQKSMSLLCQFMQVVLNEKEPPLAGDSESQ